MMHHEHEGLSAPMHATIGATVSAMGSVFAQHAQVPFMDTCLIAFFGGLAAYVGKGAVDVCVTYVRGWRDQQTNQRKITELIIQLAAVTAERDQLTRDRFKERED